MDQKQIFEMMDRFSASGLSELKVESEGFKITLKSAAAVTAAPVVVAEAAPVSSQAAPPSAKEPGDSGLEVITSPIVGTFYRSPSPDSPAFVEEESSVKSGDSLCIIEAMKIMNKLEAEFDCQIVRILAENGQMVEYGAPLFEVKRG